MDNGQFGHFNCVDVTKSSVGEMVADLLRHAKQPFTPEISTALFVAIITDTGRFTHGNTSPDSLKTAAFLVEHGADPEAISERVYRALSSNIVRLRAMAADTIHYSCGGRVALMHLTLDMFRQTESSPVDTQEFVDIPRAISGVDVAVLLREMDEKGMVKASLRSRDCLDVRRVAQQFGGGGHARAAGCEVPGGIEHVERIVLEQIQNGLQSS